MRRTEQIVQPAPRIQSRSTQYAFWLLLCAFTCLTAYAVTVHNPLSRNLLLQSLVSVAAIYACRRAGDKVAGWLETAVVTVAALAMFVHCARADLPITNVAIEIIDANVAAEVVVVPVHKENTVDPIPDWLSPWRRSNRLNFMLKLPIIGDQRSLKFRFARTNRPYQIRQISYGTDFFRLPFKLAKFADDRIAHVLRINPTNNQLDRIDDGNDVLFALSNIIRSNPAVMIPASEGFVRQNVKSTTQIKARLIWFLIHLAVILAAWKWRAINQLIRPNRNIDESGRY